MSHAMPPAKRPRHRKGFRSVRPRAIAAALTVATLLGACGGGGGGDGSAAPAASSGSNDESQGGSNPDPAASISKSTAPYAPVDQTFYAASRFLEHTTFGPTPADVESLRDGRFANWIDTQLAMSPTLVDASAIRDSRFENVDQYEFMPQQMHVLALTAPDQLRLRMSWALSQLLVVSQSRVSGFAQAQYFNMLQENGFGKYRDLLRKVTLHPAMGFYQDNALNRRAGAYPGATANENYARELMQLFSIGLVELDSDGTPKLDANGRPMPTYIQREVEALARALTGWEYDATPSDRPPTDFGNFAAPMRVNDFFHDKDEKRIVTGRLIAANGTPTSDLEAILEALSQHPNMAPFVSYRLIQHFVSGDPSPGYVARIAQVFRDSDGNLGQVLRAILLDAEARQGDAPTAVSASKGKVKEPFLGKMQLWRAFGCKSAPVSPANNRPRIWTPSQFLFGMSTVFSYYPPSFKFPGTAMTAPESKLLNGALHQFRAGDLNNGIAHSPDKGANWKAAGCDNTAWDSANGSADDAAALISKRLLRGAMPVYLRDAIAVGIYRRTWNLDSRIYDAVGMALVSPTWGVMK